MLKNPTLIFLLSIIFHLLFLSGLVILESNLFSLPITSWNNTVQWDALHYLDIRNNNYTYDGCNNPTTAFFPLFPFIWKLFPSGGSLALMLFNFSLYSLSLYALRSTFNIKNGIVLIFLALPSCFFFFMPYTESVQFVGITLLLIGIKRNELIYIFTGSLIAALSRPTFSILIPAICIVAFILIWQKQSSLKTTMNRLLIPLFLAILLGIALVNGIQYYFTGVWWAMIKAQACWDHSLHAFSFPMLSWAAEYIHRYDGLTMGLMLVITIALIVWFINLFKSVKAPSSINVPFLFSSIYLAGLGFTILLFQKDIHSINRYFVCTPFLFIFLATLLTEIKQLKVKQIVIIFLLLILVCGLFGAFGHIQTLLWYLLSIVVVMNILLTYFWPTKTLQNISILISYLVLSGFQAFLLLNFLNGMWVG